MYSVTTIYGNAAKKAKTWEDHMNQTANRSQPWLCVRLYACDEQIKAIKIEH